VYSKVADPIFFKGRRSFQKEGMTLAFGIYFLIKIHSKNNFEKDVHCSNS
jgi:hypothetical protein